MENKSNNSDPLYLQLKSELRKGIESGQYPAGSRLPSQIALTKNFEVSQITVQRAISELINEGALVARAGSGTYVVGLEQTGNALDDYSDGDNKPTKTVAIILQDIIGGYPLIQPLLQGVRARCKAHGYSLQLIEETAVTTKHKSNSSNIGRRAGRPSHQTPVPEMPDLPDAKPTTPFYSGAIFTSPVSLPRIVQLQESETPYVLLHNDIVDGVSYNVSCNYALGIMQATRHLIKQGSKDIALVTADESRYSVGQMTLGFKLAHEVSNKKYNPKRITTARYSQDAGMETVMNWKLNKNMPDGAIFASAQMARGALTALSWEKIKVPQEMTVIAFGNGDEHQEGQVELSFVDAHNRRTGELALDTLDKLMEGKKPRSHKLLVDPTLVIGESSKIIDN